MSPCRILLALALIATPSALPAADVRSPLAPKEAQKLFRLPPGLKPGEDEFYKRLVQIPWSPRMLEIRGTAEVLSSGGKALSDNFEDTIVRITPVRVIAFGIAAIACVPAGTVRR